MNTITQTGQTFTCTCGREFVAKTEGRVGVTRSNAERHAASCKAEAQTPVIPASSEVFAATNDGARRQSEGLDLEISTKSGVARMVTISNTCYLTTDGRFATVKDGETKDEAWTLYAIAPTGGIALVGKFRTCTAAFGADGALAHR